MGHGWLGDGIPPRGSRRLATDLHPVGAPIGLNRGVGVGRRGPAVETGGLVSGGPAALKWGRALLWSRGTHAHRNNGWSAKRTPRDDWKRWSARRTLQACDGEGPRTGLGPRAENVHCSRSSGAGLRPLGAGRATCVHSPPRLPFAIHHSPFAIRFAPVWSAGGVAGWESQPKSRAVARSAYLAGVTAVPGALIRKLGPEGLEPPTNRL